MDMKKLPVTCAVVCLLLSSTLTAAGEAVYSDPCDSVQGKSYAAYQNFQPAEKAMPFAYQGEGAGDATSLEVIDPSQPASAVYQVDSPGQVQILLYARQGTFATYQAELAQYLLGTMSKSVAVAQTKSCAVSSAGEIFLRREAQKLYYNSSIGVSAFYPADSPADAGWPRLGLNLEASADGSRYTAVEPVLTSVEVYTRGPVSVCYGEWYSAQLPAGTVSLRVTLRDVARIPSYNGASFAREVELELAQVNLSGGGFAQPVTPPPSSSSLPESSSSVPAPDISGSDSTSEETDKDEEEDEEEDEDDEDEEDDWLEEDSPDGSSSNRGTGGGFFTGGGTTRVVAASQAPPSASESAGPSLEEAEEATVLTVSQGEAQEEGSFLAGVEKGVILWTAVASAALFVLVYWMLRR